MCSFFCKSLSWLWFVSFHGVFVSAKMTARTYVLIFFFWAILTVITPTLIFLSHNSKLAFADSTSEKSAEIRTRKMMGHYLEEDSMKTIMALVKMQAVASGAVVVPAPAPMPTPTLESSVGIHKKR